jgi:hypothetical protein
LEKARPYQLLRGVGVAAVLATIAGILIWYQSRPSPARAWNTKALTATFDEVRVEGEKNYLTFYYSVENNTDTDYKLDEYSDIHVTVFWFSLKWRSDVLR